MKFWTRTWKKPEESPKYLKKHPLGTITGNNMQKLLDICMSIPPPGKQLDKVTGDPLNPDEPIRRCREWTADALSELRRQKVIEEPTDNQ